MSKMKFDIIIISLTYKMRNLQLVYSLNNGKQYSTQLLNYVPKHNPVLDSDVRLLEDFISSSKRIAVLTGAGISTESGIPDYRSEEVGLYARINHRPIQHQEFIKSALVRQRYWARNYVGWTRFSNSQPNAVHFSIRNLEICHNKVSSVITQNVDSLHYKAGSKNIIELHGTAFKVICLHCGKAFCRHFIQEKLSKMNPNMKETSTMVRPDGDVELSQENIMGFRPPYCDSCGGPLKPDITFFGGNVPKTRVDTVRDVVSGSNSLLVLGSSLSVFSGYRIILQAVEEKKSVCIVNIGPTRADKLVELKISAKCGDILPRIC
ncbi:NAD-dependent protein deacylase Sirt4-like [Anoplophora glabripennis]|uniref:NAD-dependent protein deacylase Sirt4-like n=1 Tax=Anoplophora glabripennis TaxID=217634 RepID=UPI00087378B1|nr:NAD-dependent protein deacylase Sirt4-like [Anoplophora glabripennis]